MKNQRKPKNIYFHEDEWLLLAEAARITKGREDKRGEFIREMALLEAQKVIEASKK